MGLAGAFPFDRHGDGGDGPFVRSSFLSPVTASSPSPGTNFGLNDSAPPAQQAENSIVYNALDVIVRCWEIGGVGVVKGW
mmetsp:Transcript_45452/g.138247  ORF Transcript_45452/g.138247 Transcript_45452/m.138247 type:complete len:80 (-) Transcript_45452:22-261(-)